MFYLPLIDLLIKFRSLSRYSISIHPYIAYIYNLIQLLTIERCIQEVCHVMCIQWNRIQSIDRSIDRPTFPHTKTGPYLHLQCRPSSMCTQDSKGEILHPLTRKLGGTRCERNSSRDWWRALAGGPAPLA